MKFSTPLFVLALASTTLASVIPHKRDLGDINVQAVPELPTNDCANLIYEQNKECFLDFNTINDIEKKCVAYKTDKCNNFYTDVVKKLEDCNALEEGRITAVNMAIASTKKYIDALCATDESNKLCPITAALGTGKIDATAYNNAINSSCKSKSCVTAATTFLELNLGGAGNNTYADTKFDKEFNVNDAKGDNDFYALAYLKSDHCTAQSSDATKLSASILLSLFVLFFTLF